MVYGYVYVGKSLVQTFQVYEFQGNWKFSDWLLVKHQVAPTVAKEAEISERKHMFMLTVDK